MRKRSTAVAIVMMPLIMAAACGSGAKETMPVAVGKQLDVALAEIESAGLSGEPEVLGGGVFGIVDESNWIVCEQVPDAGAEMTATPQLTVARSCDEDESNQPTSSDEEATGRSTEMSVGASTPPASEEPALDIEVSSLQSEPVLTAPQTLTAESDAGLALLLHESDYCSDAVAGFAEARKGEAILFDGHVDHVNNHEGYDTRYDILIGVGDFGGPDDGAGPMFQFRDVNTVSDLNYVNPGAIEEFAVDMNLRITAEVVEYEESSCLFLLKPISTEFR